MYYKLDRFEKLVLFSKRWFIFLSLWYRDPYSELAFFKVLLWNNNCICKMCSEGSQVFLMSSMFLRYLDKECIFSMYHFVYSSLIIVTLYRVVYIYISVCLYVCSFRTTQMLAYCCRNVPLDAILHYYPSTAG